MEIPQGGIGGVIPAFLLMLGKHVGNQAIAYVVSERPQNVAGFSMTSGDQRESFKTDHGVPAPIRKPMVAGDDRPDIVTGGLRSGSIGYTGVGPDDELIRSQNQLGRPTVLRFRWRNFK